MEPCWRPDVVSSTSSETRWRREGARVGSCERLHLRARRDADGAPGNPCRLKDAAERSEMRQRLRPCLHLETGPATGFSGASDPRVRKGATNMTENTNAREKSSRV